MDGINEEVGRMKCKRCKYEWERNSKLYRVTCPSCGKQWFLEEPFDDVMDYAKD